MNLNAICETFLTFSKKKKNYSNILILYEAKGLFQQSVFWAKNGVGIGPLKNVPRVMNSPSLAGEARQISVFFFYSKMSNKK